MMRSLILKVTAACLILCLCAAAQTVAAEETDDSRTQPVLELVNKTDREIAFLSVAPVGELAEAENSLPADEENLLDEDDLLAADESIQVPLTQEDTQEANAEEEAESASDESLQDILEANEIKASLMLCIVWDGADDPKAQFLIVPEDAEYAQILLDGDVPYLQYRTAQDEETASTLDVQKALAEAANAPASGSGEKTEVSRVAFPNCDDPSHGYYEITYSDGSVDYQEY